MFFFEPPNKKFCIPKTTRGNSRRHRVGYFGRRGSWGHSSGPTIGRVVVKLGPWDGLILRPYRGKPNGYLQVKIDGTDTKRLVKAPKINQYVGTVSHLRISTLIKPYFWVGVRQGGRLISHDCGGFVFVFCIQP